MNNNTSSFLLIFVGIYLLILIFLAYLGKKKSVENTMADFYLGNRSFGFLVLFFTFYATQYSGNTMIGFTAKAYRSGYWLVCSVIAMLAAVAGIFVLAPKLYKLSKKENFITPIDYLNFQYSSKLLSNFALIILLFALSTYIISNLKAAGHLLEYVSNGYFSFEISIVLMAIILVLYESVGGLRSVAFTDIIQGILILLGCGSICILLWLNFGSLNVVAKDIYVSRPEIFKLPNIENQFKWVSTILLFFFGIPLNPHAIQRIYAAKSVKSLRNSLSIMSLTPFVTTFFIIILGLYGIWLAPNLSDAESEKISLIVLEKLINHTEIAIYIAVIFIGATLAAIMSTIDSALLSFSSMITNDFYKTLNPSKSEPQLTKVGKISSWLVMFILVILAIYLPASIWRLSLIQFEVMIQLAPAFFLGVIGFKTNSKCIIFGFIVGLFITIIMTYTESFNLNQSFIVGIHPGIWGLFFNFSIVFFSRKIRSN